MNPYRIPGAPTWPVVVRFLTPEEQVMAEADPIRSPFAKVMIRLKPGSDSMKWRLEHRGHEWRLLTEAVQTVVVGFSVAQIFEDAPSLRDDSTGPGALIQLFMSETRRALILVPFQAFDADLKGQWIWRKLDGDSAS